MKQGTLRQVLRGGVLALAGLGLLAGQAAAQTELTVYTAVEAEDLKRYAEAFNEDYPDIEIKWVRDSTGIVTAKLLAEKNNPQADVVWGLAATSLLLMKGEGMLEAYAPAGIYRSLRKFIEEVWRTFNLFIPKSINRFLINQYYFVILADCQETNKKEYDGRIDFYHKFLIMFLSLY